MSGKQTIQRILVANRGEIACRVIRSVHRLGLQAIAVYSEVDADAPHVHEADAACLLGAADSAESYLNIEAIISAAQASQADAIHPGYGFLSENAEFARRVIEEGIHWIGPAPRAIALMGEKSQAKEQAKKAGVPVLEGRRLDPSLTPAERLQIIQAVGFPLLIKATYGGGGRGIRLVESAEDFESAVQTAQSEAKNAFGSAEVMVERYVQEARHIEIQVLADMHGNGVHLFERECSVQRRRQKVIEEAPSASLSAITRQRMGETALKLVNQIDYVSAGTIEFLLDAEENFYFLEMNTRLQVEHTVTEEITGIDLVEWQIKIAQGERLAFEQAELQISGHSIQARLYAEDPYQGYLPQSGPIYQFSPSCLEGLRYDHGLHIWESRGAAQGRPQLISTHYDAMIAKVIVYGDTRDIAIARLTRALTRLRCFGITTNQEYLQQILQHEDFQAASVDITWLEKENWKRSTIDSSSLMAAALLCAFQEEIAAGKLDSFYSRGGFSIEQKMELLQGEERVIHTATIQPHKASDLRIELNRFDISLDGAEPESVALQHFSSSRLCFVSRGTRHQLDYHFSEQGLWLLTAGATYLLQRPTPFISDVKEEDSLEITASMLGKVVAVQVQTGDAVQKGDVICTIEAMKMEHQMRAKADGVVHELLVSIGDQVQAGQLLGRLNDAE